MKVQPFCSIAGLGITIFYFSLRISLLGRKSGEDYRLSGVLKAKKVDRDQKKLAKGRTSFNRMAVFHIKGRTSILEKSRTSNFPLATTAKHC